jgi:hypothetical protein
MRQGSRLRIIAVLASLALLYLLLLIPDPQQTPSFESEKVPFRWDQDAFWSELRRRYEGARLAGCEASRASIDSQLIAIDELLTRVEAGGLGHDAPELQRLESALFELTALIAACSDYLPRLTARVSRMRDGVKRLSTHWNLEDRSVRERLYRMLYGGRAALEEAVLQAPRNAVPPLVRGVDEPSATPWVTLHGVTMHSGDLLVSRGGAPTSALIARANDFPGNFSHVALVHVDDHTGETAVVEAHIEAGVTLSTAEEYLADKKLRILVLRPRADHPLLLRDPMLPHKAARTAVERVRREHVRYDFRMNFEDPTELFCSEVASQAYETQGLTLWMGLSHISSPVLRTWLHGFGVEHFTTQAPSDLLYDPSLTVVAEWRDPEVLFSDHLDSAIIDALVDTTVQPSPLPYDAHLLPLARVVKAYSMLRNLLGSRGPVPEGMSATAALRNTAFSARHASLKERLRARTERYQEDYGYPPPYWELVSLAADIIASDAS